MATNPIHRFLEELQSGQHLCVMPIPRLELADEIPDVDGVTLFPAGMVDFDELRIVSYPKLEFDRKWPNEAGILSLEGHDLGWFKSATTLLTPDDFSEHALAAFTHPVHWGKFLDGDHDFHLSLLRECSERVERAMDLVRFDFCRLHLPETLPGRAGTFGLGNPFSGGLFYTLNDHESYIVGGQIVTHLLASGIGLEVSVPPSHADVGNGETGNIARVGLSMFSAAMESNSLSSKFIQCMSLLDYLAFPNRFAKMEEAKREIAAHVTADKAEQKAILDDVRSMTSLKVDGMETGIRTNIVHLGKRFEDIVLEPDRNAIFHRLERYIGITLNDLIRFSNEPWEAVIAYRNARKA